ncbi:hypothetical protein ASG17_14640 [Brevundimonas sp. Leaf363]|uniref:hypothetical protein n=1 Tax=Brevundimonas sp. Leaf363 TaxID=1736353 RepID=UPI0006FC3C6C|nr:hypothetical protein [Brevundimonas sp. Leaf363]KQS53748.1 hypothetical protein ASG17_14640 [Brevundimonas sp. Leaf363]
MLKRWIFALATLCAIAAASPAAAEWKRAESERFIVYSQGGERELVTYVQKLETFDYIVRLRLGLSTDAPPRKFPVYLLRNRRDLLQVLPGAGENIQGVYIPRNDDIFALSMTGGDHTLLHEYFHHLSIATGGLAAYPGWLVEGLAEYYATADVLQSRVTLGGYEDNTAYWLSQSSWLPLETLLTERPSVINTSAVAPTYYPVAWLLTHYFMNDESRRPLLQAYVRDVSAGGDPVEAMQRATGMDLAALKTELRGYMRDRITLTRYSFQRAPAEITVTTLPPSADDLLLIGQRLSDGVADEDKAPTLAAIRTAAARYPDDAFALLQLGRAEMDLGDKAIGEATLQRVLEIEPANVGALQRLAAERIDHARDETDYQASLATIREARAYLARAYQADPTHFYTLQMLAETRQWSQSYPNDNDLLTWDQAFNLAPQLPNIRFGYANALMQAGKNDEAIILMKPIANAPHNDGQAEAAQQMIDRALAGQAPLSQEALDAAADEPSEPVDEPAPQ